MIKRPLLLSMVLGLLLPLSASARQSQRFGPYELHYSVVNSTFVDPKVAASYQITRGKDKAFLNLAVREHVGDRSEGRPMQLKGRSWDLLGRSGELEFQEIREGQAIYYIAQFEFSNEEWRHFEIFFRPEGATETYTFKHKHQMYEN